MSRNLVPNPTPATRRNLLLALGCTLAASLAAPHVARAAPRTVRFGHINPDQSHMGLGATAFAEAVAASPSLNQLLRVEVHGNSEFGDELSMFQNCIKGSLEGMLCSNVVIGNEVPQFGPLNAPYLFRDAPKARSVLEGPLGAELAGLLHTKGVEVLAWGENGVRHITGDRPIRTPADLRGMKLRVPQSEIMLGGFRALGADPAPMSFKLLRDSLINGVFQGQENSIATVEANKLFEVQKFLSLTGHIYDPALFLWSSDWLEDLSTEQRATLKDCAQKGAVVTRRVCDLSEAEGVARLQSAGMTVVADVDRPAFKAAAQPFLDSLAQKSGGDLVHRLIQAGV